MGFYFRKSKKFGPFRLNFSKSGVGASFGVKGARISSGPRGTYVNVGSNGFYYRQRIDKQWEPTTGSNVNTRFNSDSSDKKYSNFHQNGLAADISSKELLDQINSKLRMTPHDDLAFAACFTILSLGIFPLNKVAKNLLSFDSNAIDAVTLILFLSWFAGGLLLLWRSYQNFKLAKTTSLTYELSGAPLQRFNAIRNACAVLSKSSTIWRLQSSQVDWNQPLDVLKEQPPFIKTNVEVWSLDSNNVSIYFLPDYVFLWANGEYSTIPYESLKLRFRTDSFSTWSSVPSDATVLGYDYLHRRKDGGPDQRYKHNPTYAIVECAFVEIASLRLQVTNVRAARTFVDIFNQKVLNRKSGDGTTAGRSDRTNKNGSGETRYERKSENYQQEEERKQSYQKTHTNQSQNKPTNSVNADVRSAHEVLEIRIGATKEEIISAYREMVRSYHPDKVAQHSPKIAQLAEEKMKEINRAYETLKANKYV